MTNVSNRALGWPLARLGGATAALAATLSVLAGCTASGEAPVEHTSTSAQELTCVTLRRPGPGVVEDTNLVTDPTDPTRASANFGTATVLTVGALGTSQRDSLLRFDLAPIPAGATITSATLALRKASSLGSGTVSLFRVTAPWSESTVTYSSFAGAFDSSVQGTFDPATMPTGGVTNIDLTSLVQAWYGGTFANYGVMLSAPATGRVNLGASEGTAISRPSLVVCYAPASCADGVQNGTETGVDCGGPCVPCSNPCAGVTCAPLDACHVAGVCNPSTGICSNPVALFGTPCDDGDACTTLDTCQSGACVGASPVTCSALDACHAVGVCDTQTGVCSNPPVADGTACDDGDACTTIDACQGGVCVGAGAVTCSALDACHAVGVCDTQTGVCSNPPVADGTACDDGDLCTGADVCQAGVCGGPAQACCSDGTQNQGELGVDCGGPCAPCPGPSLFVGGYAQNDFASISAACPAGSAPFPVLSQTDADTLRSFVLAASSNGTYYYANFFGNNAVAGYLSSGGAFVDSQINEALLAPLDISGNGGLDPIPMNDTVGFVNRGCGTCLLNSSETIETGRVVCQGTPPLAPLLFAGNAVQNDFPSIASGCPLGSSPFVVASPWDVETVRSWVLAAGGGTYYFANFFANNAAVGYLATSNAWYDASIVESTLAPMNIAGNANIDPIPMQGGVGFVNRGCGNTCLLSSFEAVEAGVAICTMDPPAPLGLFTGSIVQNDEASIRGGCPGGTTPFEVHSQADADTLRAYVYAASTVGEFYYANFFANNTQAGWLSGPATFSDAGIVESALAPLGIAGNANLDPIPVNDVVGFANRGCGSTCLLSSFEAIETGHAVCAGSPPPPPALVIGSTVQNDWNSIKNGCPPGTQPFAVKTPYDADVLRNFVLAASSNGTFFFANFFANNAAAGYLNSGGSWIDAAIPESSLAPLNVSGNGGLDPIPMDDTNGYVNRGCGTCLFNSAESVQTGFVVCQ